MNIKNSIFLFIISLSLFSGCKKSAVATDTADILGTWYYQSYDVKYYSSNLQVIYDDIAPQQRLHDNLPYTFNKDNSVTYDIGNYNYIITSNGKADSLIFNGRRFAIVSINKNQLILQQSYPEVQYFQGGGQYVTSAYAESYGVFSRVQVPAP
jgi:hypothetical protein